MKNNLNPWFRITKKYISIVSTNHAFTFKTQNDEEISNVIISLCAIFIAKISLKKIVK